MPEPRAKATAEPPTAAAGTDAGLRVPRAAERACRKRAPLTPVSEEEHQAERALEGLLLRSRECLGLRIGRLEDVLERLGPVVLDGRGRGAVCLDERVAGHLVGVVLDHP